MKSEQVSGPSEVQHRAVPAAVDSAAPEVQVAPAQDRAAGLFAAGKVPAGGRLPGGSQHRALLALQRSAGNQAVNRLVRPAARTAPAAETDVAVEPGAAEPGAVEPGAVEPGAVEPREVTAQREVTVQRDQPPPPIGSAVQIMNGVGKPTIAGTTHTEAIDHLKVKIIAPETSFASTDVGLPHGVKLGNGKSILVGVMQTLMGSNRNAHYRSPGASPADPPIVKKESLGQSRDALASMGDDKKIIPRPGTPAPFYGPPDTLSDSKPDGTITFAESKDGVNPTPGLMDRPGWPARLALGAGEFEPKLVGTSGADSFLTSIVAKYSDGAELAHFNKVAWAVPWDQEIDAFGAGTGGSAGKVIDSNMPPPETEGDIAAVKAAAGGGKSWIAFPTLGDAMMCPVGILLGNLQPARDNDPASFQHTLDALIAKKPTYEVNVTVKKKLRGVGKEKLSIALKTGTMTFNPYAKQLDEGETQTFAFGLMMMFNRDTIGTGEPITFSVSAVPVFGDSKSASTTMAAPYVRLDQILSIEDGSYHVDARLKG